MSNASPVKKRGRGRPPFQPTAAQRDRVKTCAAAGMPHDELALGLGIDANTLRKHFQYELGQGALNRKQEAMDALWKLAKRGNVSALKTYINKIEEYDATLIPPPPPRITDEEALAAEKGEAKPEKLGKKEQADADAVTAGNNTEWADLLPSNARAQ